MNGGNEESGIEKHDIRMILEERLRGKAQSGGLAGDRWRERWMYCYFGISRQKDGNS